MIRRALLIPLLAGLLAGCATLSEDECRTADWHDLGVQDGRKGYTEDRLREHRKACKDVGIRPDEKRYAEGRRQGLKDYCRIDSVLEAGRRGDLYQGVCPATLDRPLREVNRAAYDIYQAGKEIDSLDSQISNKERQLRDKKTSDETRSYLRQEIRDLDRRRDRLQDELYSLRRALDRAVDAARRDIGRD